MLYAPRNCRPILQCRTQTFLMGAFAGGFGAAGALAAGALGFAGA